MTEVRATLRAPFEMAVWVEVKQNRMFGERVLLLLSIVLNQHCWLDGDAGGRGGTRRAVWEEEGNFV